MARARNASLPRQPRSRTLSASDPGCGGTEDPALRAHDTRTGEILATLELPASTHAGPITYRTRPDGPQYLVVAAGGNFSSQLGDWIIAYALPAEAR